MSYTPHIQVRYRLARRGEIPDGRTVEIKEQPGSQSAIVFAPGHSSRRLVDGITQLSSHQIVHGTWRQRWTADGRMQRPAQGLMVAVSRWERVPGRLLPSGRVVAGVEEDGSCVWLVDEDECTQQAQNAMNDLLLRLAGDGLWVQCWFNRQPQSAAASPASPLTAPVGPYALA